MTDPLRYPPLKDFRYVIPNGVTSVGMTLGLVAIYLSLNGHFENAAWLLFLCVMLDKLDGTLARLLDAGSAIGMQLDSFSDFITFCVAPSVMFVGILTQEGSPLASGPGSLMAYSSAIVYVLSGALRLARFNTIEDTGEGLRFFFVGIPTTLCGALVNATYLTLVRYVDLADFALWMPALLVLCAMLMNVPIYLPKLNKKRQFAPVLWFQVFNLFVTPVLVIGHWLPEYLLFLVLVYIVIGVAWSNRPSVTVE